MRTRTPAPAPSEARGACRAVGPPRGCLADALDALTREATLGQLKLDHAGASFFDMPVIEQVRLWNATKGLRGFRAGGIWRDAGTAKSDEQLAQEEQAAGELIATLAPAAWTALASETRHLLSALIEDVRYSRACVAAVWAAAQAMAFNQVDPRALRDTLVSMIPAQPPPEGGTSG